jgi:exosortase
MHETTLVPVTPPGADSATGPQAKLALDSQTGLKAHGQTAAPWQIAWGPVGLLGALLVVLYHGIAVKLVTDWYELPDFSHGFLIPFFAAFLLWDNRKALSSTPLEPSWAGTILVALGLFELLLGRLGADLFLQRTSFVVLVAGLIWTLLGKPMLGRLKFVLFVLLLAIPLPTILFNQITFPLQLLASRFASDLLQLAQVPVLRDGNIIQLPAMPLEVAEACSGIRSLMSLFTVAVIYGYFLERATWRRVVLALSALPIAVTANVARIFGTGMCVQYWDPEKAMGFFHEFSGWLMFLVSLGCLYLVHVAMTFAAGKEGEAG